MNFTTKTIAVLLLCFCCASAVSVSVANADYTVSNSDPSFVFALTSAKNTDHQQDWAGFQFTFQQLHNESGDIVGTRLTFDLTDYGYSQGLAGGSDAVKFKDFKFDPNNNDWVSGMFTSDPVSWNNGGWTPTFTDLLFADGMSWDDFAAAVLNGEIGIHILSINDGNYSINGAVFTYVPQGSPAPTPEPATLLIFGLGIAGAGIAARRRK